LPLPHAQGLIRKAKGAIGAGARTIALVGH
jgi:hypothetical protein